jgi:Lon protease-like protein
MVEIPTLEELSPLTEDELAVTPLFPLPRAVFFPGTVLPLHFFEPRYRTMVDDCIARGPRTIAVALLAPGWESDYEGRPPVVGVAGIGRIVWHEKLEDGRHNVVLVGMSRIAVEELPAAGLPYRRARGRVLSDRGEARPAEVGSLLSCASAVEARIRRTHQDFSLEVPATDPPGRIADTLADRLVAEVERRQQILETLDVSERVRLVTDAISDLLVELEHASGRGSLH